MEQDIFIKGAREHNLKNIDVSIPRNKLVVITGISGSGKSSLAFDTLYAEGQRRYMESLSTYARQFMGVMQKPDVDFIEGLSPAIAIEPRTAARNPRSTVATVTEIYDYLRVLFARVGKPYCPNCNVPISKMSTDQIIDALLAYPDKTKLVILAPKIRGRKGEYRDLWGKLARKGFVRARVDGEIIELDSPPILEKYKQHTIEVVIDRIVLKPNIRKRLADSVELALSEGEGLCTVLIDGKNERIFSQSLACTQCGFSYPELSPRLFSFNSPYGACPVCHGLGTKMEIDPDRLIANPRLSILEGTLTPWGEPQGWALALLRSVAKHYKFDLAAPWAELSEETRNIVLYGSPASVEVKYVGRSGHRYEGYERFEGIANNLMRLHRETESDYRRRYIEGFMSILPCPKCGGDRLKPEALSVRIGEANIREITRFSVREATEFFANLKLSKHNRTIVKEVIKEISERLRFLVEVGVAYLTLDRTADTLAGGEEQRVRLATQIGSRLVGVIYILDEPTIGLHPRDNRRLLSTLAKLRDLGNTVVVVEHDRDTIESADHVIDLGPGAGAAGGRIVAQGTPEEIKSSKRSLTGRYLTGKCKIEVPSHRRSPNLDKLVVKGARHNNLKNMDVEFPLGLFICVTGVSGSGKSSLVADILYRALARRFYRSRSKPGAHDRIEGLEYIDKVINIDQSPIGRTPRSNPATYTQAFGPIRELFAKTKEARIRGYKPGRFSFNVRGGRCERCSGEGTLRIEMHFLPDVYVPCEVCRSKRYNRETMEVRFKGRNIAEVLDMTVDEALEFFRDIPPVARKLRLLKDVGLGYIKLGQSAPSLSGGEAQRIKLAKELSKIPKGHTVYLLDEPTTGLHFEDVKMLLSVLQRLVEKRNTVIVIEHNPDVIKCADWIIDLGPEGGDEGGHIVAQGPPEKIAKSAKSYTGRFLKGIL
ncbi:excinuclease ABC subunit A [candidate division TA06 bacterium B3_TA06]|uniref:UvrABC system protein A n=1 Tax=candidate division TA06 bacterium B3_TA06 TaxID=2012487 RepID=A0A532V9M4_UNCT6|nr:MAG: excinuclease ABC subunit A [candidate division TA06 bacterium B3_TA06]